MSRFDAQTFEHLTTNNGLPSAVVRAMIRDRDGALWFGTEGGLSRYDGNTLTTLTTADGLAHNSVSAVVEDLEGHLWIGTPEGVDRYDGREFTSFATWKSSFGPYIFADQAGHLWFDVRGEPLRRYDGKQLTETTAASDPIPQDVWRVYFQDRAGRLWFNRRGGDLILYDGKEFTTLTTADGLAVNGVPKLEDRHGNVWLGLDFPPTRSGAGKYDGERLTTITTREGLADNDVRSILQDPEGHFWFGTAGGGVSLYHGLVFQNLSRRDGLVHDTVGIMHQDANGDVWIATEGGVSRYRPHRTPPSINITDIVTDRRLGPVDEVRVSETQDLLVFEFRGGSFSTLPDRMAYVYQLEGHDEERRWTRESRVEYTDLTLGDYTFQLQAVDRDLNYSDPLTVRVTVHRAHGSIALVIALLLGVAGTVAGSTVAVRRRSQRDRAQQERDDARTELVQERRRLIQVQSHSIERWTVDEFIETSQPMRAVFEQIRDLQQDDRRALIVGEQGVGKELVARAIHCGGKRADHPFVAVRCATLPVATESLAQRTAVMSELFGHVAGAFPEADADQDGLLQQAQGGTLFLDEVGMLPPPLQSQLSRVFTSQQVRRLGDATDAPLDVRILAATSEAVETLVEVGDFNRELYEYLAVYRIDLPPCGTGRRTSPCWHSTSQVRLPRAWIEKQFLSATRSCSNCSSSLCLATCANCAD